MRQRQKTGELKPVAYISRAMTPTERRYAQIEKEALAFTWACERLSDYLTGMRFHINTDHKPLVPLFSTKNLEELPLRVQRFRLCMMRFSFDITRSRQRTCNRNPTPTDHLQEETRAFVNLIILQQLPATDRRLEEIKQCQARDDVCQAILQFSQSGWPQKNALPRSHTTPWQASFQW